MNEQALPPAGWYYDPEGSGELRYWDGTGWTSHYAPMPASAPPAVPKEYASFGRRTVAFLCDCAIVLLLFGWFARVLRWQVGRPWWASVVIGIVVGGAWFAYQWFSLHRWRATPGMRLCDVSVRYLDDDPHRAILRRAAVFAVVFGISTNFPGIVGGYVAAAAAVAFGVGCLMMLGGALGQTWHDRWSRTQIIDNQTIRSGGGAATIPPLSVTSRNVIVVLCGIGVLMWAMFSAIDIVLNIDEVLRSVPTEMPGWSIPRD